LLHSFPFDICLSFPRKRESVLVLMKTKNRSPIPTSPRLRRARQVGNKLFEIVYYRKVHILFVTSEVAGIFKLGGLADVSLSLPLELAREHITITVALPFYSTIDVTGASGVGELAVDFGGKREIVLLFEKPLGPDGGTLLLFRHPRLNEYKKSPIQETFAFFSKAVSTFYIYGTHLVKTPIDIVHCNDWHTALVPLLIGEQSKLAKTQTLQSRQTKTIITIHNLLYQGVVRDTIIDQLNAPRELFHMIGNGRNERVSFLREGLEYADAVTTVSPTYAKEIVVAAHRDGIGDVLVKRRNSVVGIVNGIDTQLWNPDTDTSLTENFSQSTVFTVKPDLKTALQEEVGLKTASLPVLGFIGRIEPRQKGIELILEASAKLFNSHEFQLVILGTGDKKTTEAVTTLAKAHKNRISFINMFNEGLAHRIYAGCDMLLVPSKFEPCGLTQMIAMRYGTVPIVRKTGGLADTVVDATTGFVFDQYSVKGLSSGILRGLAALKDTVAWQRLISACMGQDFSWTRSAKRYIELYKKLQND
jgi:starch synthase